jgi:hypothetical protein
MFSNYSPIKQKKEEPSKIAIGISTIASSFPPLSHESFSLFLSLSRKRKIQRENWNLGFRFFVINLGDLISGSQIGEKLVITQKRLLKNELGLGGFKHTWKPWWAN